MCFLRFTMEFLKLVESLTDKAITHSGFRIRNMEKAFKSAIKGSFGLNKFNIRKQNNIL